MFQNKAQCSLVMGILTAFMILPQSASAATLVATINGYYDVDGYDTPSLHIFNTTGFDFTNVTLTLTGYQGLNNGVSQSVGLANILAGTTGFVTWGAIPGANNNLTAGNLFSYDYDDSYTGTFTPITGSGRAPSGMVLAPQCAPQANLYGWNYCAQVGNFYVTFTATWNGQAIYSRFSPDPNLPGVGNAAGSFVAWLGLDPQGWAETTYDAHSNGGPNGVLANIYVGTPPPVGSVPEPAALALMGSGLIGLAILRRKRTGKA
jgi:hypothetical protein